MHVKRSAEEVAYVVKAWDTYVHERAKALWKTPARRYSILCRFTGVQSHVTQHALLRSVHDPMIRF